MVVWSARDWQRVGSVIDVRDSALLGRGEPQFGDSHRRAELVLQRPGTGTKLPSLANPRISRSQLVLRKEGAGFSFERVGRCRVLVNGEEVSAGRLAPDDLLELAGQLLVLCTLRPSGLPPCQSFPSDAIPAFGEPDRFGFVGESPAAWILRDQLAFVARHTGHVLLLGPSGSGKELAARALHELAGIRRPMVARNAATFPATLIEAELFGNTKDYPNRGMVERPGLIGAADGSTLFLDEIAELPQDLQARLLRVLDEGGEYHRLGDAKPKRASFRLVGATNRPVSELRADVAARMRLRIYMPDLQARREDIPLMLAHLLRIAARQDPALGGRFFRDGDPAQPKFAVELMRALVAHGYERNVRELDALLWSSLATSRSDHLELTDAVQAELQSSGCATPAKVATDYTPEQVQACLDKHGGDQAKAWRELGFANRHVLKRLIKKHALRTSGL